MKKLIVCVIFFVLSCGTVTGNSREDPLSNNIKIDGSTLYYTIEGNGIPCLVIGSSVYYPKTFSPKLRDYLKMYFVDMKWFAPVYHPENLDSITIRSLVEDIEQIRKALGLIDPVIIGHSIHGTIAMEYIKSYPHHASAVIVIGSPAEFGNETFTKKAADLWNTASNKRKALQEKNWGDITEIDRLKGKEATAAAYNRSAPQYWHDPYYDANWLWDGMTVHTEVTTHLFTKVFSNYNMFKETFEIKVPVCVIMGLYDYVIPYTLWERSYDNIPDFTLILFKKSGHTPQLEQSRLFDKKLIKWLTRHDVL